MYLVTMLGNLLIILAISSDSHLHTLMYFFLSHQSFVDNLLCLHHCPQDACDIQSQNKDISYTGCFTQVYFLKWFLREWMVFSWPEWPMVGLWPSANPCTTWSSWTHVCVASWFFWCVGSSFSGCSDSYSVEATDILYWHWIPHFFCELAQIIKVACSDTFINNICLYVVTALLGVFPLTGILLLPNHLLFNENVLCSMKT